VKRLLLEGGGGANGAFLRAGLVDELHVILCPAVDARRAHRACLTPLMPKPTAGHPSFR
jgi:riboflavin biosynthesis pyrimidine reductase